MSLLSRTHTSLLPGLLAVQTVWEELRAPAGSQVTGHPTWLCFHYRWLQGLIRKLIQSSWTGTRCCFSGLSAPCLCFVQVLVITLAYKEEQDQCGQESSTPRWLLAATSQLAGFNSHWGIVILWACTPNTTLLKKGMHFIFHSWPVHENGTLLFQPALHSFGMQWEKQEGMFQAIVI